MYFILPLYLCKLKLAPYHLSQTWIRNNCSKPKISSLAYGEFCFYLSFSFHSIPLVQKWSLIPFCKVFSRVYCFIEYTRAGAFPFRIVCNDLNLVWKFIKNFGYQFVVKFHGGEFSCQYQQRGCQLRPAGGIVFLMPSFISSG